MLDNDCIFYNIKHYYLKRTTGCQLHITTQWHKCCGQDISHLLIIKLVKFHSNSLRLLPAVIMGNLSTSYTYNTAGPACPDCYRSSMDREHGTVCQPILEHQIRPSAPSSVISRPTCFSSSLHCCWQVGSAPFVRRRCDCSASSAPFTNIQTYLLTYLLTYLQHMYGFRSAARKWSKMLLASKFAWPKPHGLPRRRCDVWSLSQAPSKPKSITELKEAL